MKRLAKLCLIRLVGLFKFCLMILAGMFVLICSLALLVSLDDWYSSYRLRQLESQLIQVYQMQEHFHVKHGEYSRDLESLGITPELPSGAVLKIAYADWNNYLAYATWPGIEDALFVSETCQGKPFISYSSERSD